MYNLKRDERKKKGIHNVQCTYTEIHLKWFNVIKLRNVVLMAKKVDEKQRKEIDRCN